MRPSPVDRSFVVHLRVASGAGMLYLDSIRPMDTNCLLKNFSNNADTTSYENPMYQCTMRGIVCLILVLPLVLLRVHVCPLVFLVANSTRTCIN